VNCVQDVLPGWKFCVHNTLTETLKKPVIPINFFSGKTYVFSALLSADAISEVREMSVFSGRKVGIFLKKSSVELFSTVLTKNSFNRMYFVNFLYAAIHDYA